MGQTLQLHVPYLHNRTVGTIVDLLLHVKLPQQRLPAKEAARHVQVPGEGANNAMGKAAQQPVLNLHVDCRATAGHRLDSGAKSARWKGPRLQAQHNQQTTEQSKQR